MIGGVDMDDNILQAFKFSTIQGCRDIKRKLDELGIPWAEFEEWVEDKAGRIEPIARGKTIPPPPRKALKRKCPQCGSWLRLFEVNHSPCAQVGEGLKSQWLCWHCEWQEFSARGVIEEADKYTVEE